MAGLEGLQNLPLLKAENFRDFERSKVLFANLLSFLKTLEFSELYSFELRDSILGSLPFSEFRRFGRLKRIRP